MKRLIFGGFVALALTMCVACVPPPDKITLGDSVGYQIGTGLDAENDAVGGSTVCDTAFGTLPDVGSKVFIHVGGHSWGQYGPDAAQSCLLSIIDHYRSKRVFVATAPQALAIFCQWGSYEYDLRIKDFDSFKRGLTRPNVVLVDLNGIGTGPDCTHLTEQGISTAASRVKAKGF